jgi:hypothetical protein
LGKLRLFSASSSRKDESLSSRGFFFCIYEFACNKFSIGFLLMPPLIFRILPRYVAARRNLVWIRKSVQEIKNSIRYFNMIISGVTKSETSTLFGPDISTELALEDESKPERNSKDFAVGTGAVLLQFKILKYF